MAIWEIHLLAGFVLCAVLWWIGGQTVSDMAIACGLILIVIVIGVYGCCAFDPFDD